MDETERIERRLKLHDLRVLMSVVEQGSMAKAAERLATSQPAVSRTIADLEHSLSVRLLDRGPRGIVPTPYGRALIKRSVTVFDELRLGVKDLEFLADPTAGEVRIATAIARAVGFLAVVIDRFARRHPRVVCHLITGELSMIYRALEERDVDALITGIPTPLADHLQAEALYTSSQFVVASTENPWSRRRRVTLADLMNDPWTLPPPDSPHGASAVNDFRAAGLDVPRATVITYTDIARLALVAKGRFLTIANTASFTGLHAAIKALPIELASAHRSAGICLWPRLCENSTRYQRTLNFEGCGQAESKKMQKFVRRSTLRPNQFSFSHSLDPLPRWRSPELAAGY
jgi:DNA-binding transcriptional LysR family regulator